MNTKYIKKLHVKGFRAFDELNVEFNPRFNFIVGPNGCGKTSLLRAIILSYSDISLNDSRYSNDFEAWVDFFDSALDNYEDSKLYRIGCNPDHCNIKNEYRQNPAITRIKQPPFEGQANSFHVRQASGIKFAPLVLGAFRKIDYKRMDGMKREEPIANSINAYIENAPTNLYGGRLPNVKQWMINRYFVTDKDWAVNEKINWNWLMKHIGMIAPKEINFHFNAIGKDLEPTFKLNDKICYLEELSAGFQSVLSLVFSIIEWIESTNEGENMLIENATGTVIIDELDVHLHPEWQLILRDSLAAMFPNLQFITTTHSPHLIATAREGEVIVMNEGSVLDLKPQISKFSGWNTEQILEEIMDVKSLDNKEYTKLVNEAMDFIELKDSKNLEATMYKLKKIAHPNDTIISVIKIKLASLKLGDKNDKVE